MMRSTYFNTDLPTFIKALFFALFCFFVGFAVFDLYRYSEKSLFQVNFGFAIYFSLFYGLASAIALLIGRILYRSKNHRFKKTLFKYPQYDFPYLAICLIILLLGTILLKSFFVFITGGNFSIDGTVLQQDGIISKDGYLRMIIHSARDFIGVAFFTFLYLIWHRLKITKN